MAEKLDDLYSQLRLEVDRHSFAVADALFDKVKEGLVFVASFEGAKWLGEAVMGVVEYGSHLNDLATQSGATVESLQELGFAAKLNSSSMDEMAVGLRFLSRNMYNAQRGSKEAASAFAALGVKTMGADGQLRPVRDVLYDVADAIQKLPAAARAGAAMSVLGRSGASLVPTLAEGSAGLRKYAAEAKEFGEISTDDAHRLDDLGDNVDRLKYAGKALWNEALIKLTPTLMEASEAAIAWIKANRADIVDAFRKAMEILLSVFRKVGTAIQLLGKGVAFFSTHADLATDAAIGLAAAMAILKRESLAASGASLAGWGLSLAKFGLWGAAIAGAVAGFRWLYGEIQEGKGATQIFDDAVDGMKKAWGEAMAYMREQLGGFYDEIKRVTDSIEKDAEEGTGFWGLPGVHQLGQLGKGIGRGARALTDFGHDLGKTAAENSDQFALSIGGERMSISQAREANAAESRRDQFLGDIRAGSRATGGGGGTFAPTLRAEINVHGASDADAAAQRTKAVLTEWWHGTMRDASAATGGGR